MNHKLLAIISFVILLWIAVPAVAQTTTFTYRGNLGLSITGSYDLQFKLFDALSGGTQQGSTLEQLNIAVTNGDYKVNLDFGACSSCFSGADRFLEVGYRLAGGGTYTVVSPREQITSAPYAIRSSNSAAADSLSTACVNCVNSGQIASVNGSAVAGTIPVSGVPAGSANYIQNTTTQQPSASFNISGNGTANVFNAIGQFNQNGSRVLYSSSASNIYVGLFAGFRDTGFSNSFVGDSAGFANTSGNWNSFFGSQAGLNNVSGVGNSFFGSSAGRSNTANENSFFGTNAGITNVSGNGNAFFGQGAGYRNDSGSNNAFFGSGAGGSNTSGSQNTLLGAAAGLGNTIGQSITLVGYAANVSANSLTNATAIGSGAVVSQNNSLVLGSTGTNVGIGQSAPSASLYVAANTTNSGNNTAVFEDQAIGPNASHVHWGTNGDWYIRSAASAGRVILQDSGGNVGIGTSTPNDKLEVNGVLRVNVLGSVGGTQLCRNLSNQIANCSSSLRYKTNIAPFSLGLSFINRLRPITFDWKQSGTKDVGFGAEDVAQVNPLFVTYNDKGEVEGVKYDRLSAAFVNAFKEQQAQIERQQREIDALKKLVCATNAAAEVCKTQK